MSPDRARVVQISDTHFAATEGRPPEWDGVLAWLRADPPDLVVLTGDLVFEDPDDDADRDLARRLLGELPAPWRAIPGNHDIGFFGDDAERPRRLDTFRDTYGDDRFLLDLAGWRVVGADTYLLGTAEHDEWLQAAVASGRRPVLAFVHQPLAGDPADGWELPAPAAEAFGRATWGADVRVVASGHRHCSLRLGRAVWAPSLRLAATDPVPAANPRPGVVEHVLTPGGGHAATVVRHLGADVLEFGNLRAQNAG